MWNIRLLPCACLEPVSKCVREEYMARMNNVGTTMWEESVQYRNVYGNIHELLDVCLVCETC